MSRKLFLIVAATSPLVSPAYAQVDTPLVTAVPRCLEIKGSADRLACFERAARAIQDAMGGRSTAGRAAEVPAPAQFGLSRRQVTATRPPEKVKPRKAEPVRELSALIAGITPTGNGYRLNLDDGSEWNVTNSSLGRAPEKGDRILIETGVLSGYRATIPGKAGLLRVRRIR